MLPKNRPFNPELDSVLYNQILNLAKELNIKPTQSLLTELYGFCFEIETAFEKRFQEALNKPPPVIFIPTK